MFRKLIPILFVVFAFSACSTDQKTKNELTYWSSNNMQEITFTRYFVKKWNDNHTNKIKFQPIPEGQSSEEVLMAAVVGKTTPDIYANMWQGLVEMYAKSGVLVQLDTIKGFVDFIKKRSGEKVLKEITSTDGHIYQIPWKINPIMSVYNKKEMDKIGLQTAPKTYEAFLKAGKMFSKDTNNDGYIDQWIGNTSIKNIWYQRLFDFYSLYLAASNGGHLIENNKPVFNNKYALEVLTFLQQLYKKQYFAKENNATGSDKFLGGQYATKWTGPWDISYTNKFKPKGFEFGYSPIPVPNSHQGPVYTYADPKNIVIFNTCKNPLKAWAFIKTLISEKGDLKLLSLTEQLPRRQKMEASILFQDYFKTHPKIVPFIKQSNYVYGTDNCELMIEVLSIISDEYEASVVYNKKTPKAALDAAEKAINILLGNFKTTN
ncbi:extracellular solute-binding protein [Lutibacter sp.]|uniref:extracellular solute-binding protein n=1 Tax=Lutibacter sp. TaxID=1925666 RepID=UPI0025C027E6|nr:extracellular solute-binding protein [Lutibacter sp.]MCF6181926.1 extracellular solute-binding protein [Lutibacter sp.]